MPFLRRVFFTFASSLPQCTLAWMRQVCGRMKSDYQYSVSVVYKNYPWPLSVTENQRAAVEAAAQAVLDARGAVSNVSPWLISHAPLTMPAPLLKAHQALDLRRGSLLPDRSLPQRPPPRRIPLRPI